MEAEPGDAHDTVIETIGSPDALERVIILRRPDGRCSFRKQLREDPDHRGPGAFVWPAGFVEETGWWPPGPYLGIYDSAATARWEAMCKIGWLASTLHPN